MRSRQLLKLHLALQSAMGIQHLFAFPPELLGKSMHVAGCEDKPHVEQYLRSLLSRKQLHS